MLSVPDFFDPRNAEDWGHRPDPQMLLNLAPEWRRKHDIKFSATDPKLGQVISLLVIDAQKDFTHPEGSLFVAGSSGRGAVDDNVRLCEFIYRNLNVITDVKVTLDSHGPYQIFFPEFWVDSDGRHPSANRTVSVDDVLSEDLVPNPAMAGWVSGGNYAWLKRQVEFYVKRLEEAGKYDLFLWPHHCLVGSDGHALAGIVQEARLFFSYVRASGVYPEIKGYNHLTENYSVLAPEVLERHDGHALAQRNTRFFNALMSSDVVVIAGQAASHCVAWTIQDLKEQVAQIDPDLAKKVYILRDCTSSVVIDGVVDFTNQAEEAMHSFEAAGMNLVESTTPIEDWPGVSL